MFDYCFRDSKITYVNVIYAFEGNGKFTEVQN